MRLVEIRDFYKSHYFVMSSELSYFLKSKMAFLKSREGPQNTARIPNPCSSLAGGDEGSYRPKS